MIGPSVTTTPSYHISAIANNPNSMLAAGVTSFSVLVTPPVQPRCPPSKRCPSSLLAAYQRAVRAVTDYRPLVVTG